MSNTSKGSGQKGSKKRVQELVNEPELCRELSRAVSGREKLYWISPLEAEDFAEYKLNQKNILEWLGVADGEVDHKLFSFWPWQQPQWDALAVSLDHRDFYLVEAKAHTSEVRTKLSDPKSGSAKSLENHELIIRSMEEAFRHYHLSEKADFSSWTDRCYQLGNRLTFLYFLNSRFPGKIRFHLVLLNFVNDSYIPTTAEEWETHYETIWTEMLGAPCVPLNVQVLNWHLG